MTSLQVFRSDLLLNSSGSKEDRGDATADTGGGGGGGDGIIISSGSSISSSSSTRFGAVQTWGKGSSTSRPTSAQTMLPVFHVADVRISLPFSMNVQFEVGSFELDRGQICCIAGPSGCGKSLFLDTLAAAVPGSRRTGTLVLDGQTPEGIGAAAWRTKVLRVPQTPPQLRMTASKNMNYYGPHRLMGCPDSNAAINSSSTPVYQGSSRVGAKLPLLLMLTYAIPMTSSHSCRPKTFLSVRLATVHAQAPALSPAPSPAIMIAMPGTAATVSTGLAAQIMQRPQQLCNGFCALRKRWGLIVD